MCSSHNFPQQVHQHEPQFTACGRGCSCCYGKSTDLNDITFKATFEMAELNYAELVRIAERLLKHDRLRWTIEPKELVHEMYLRLVKSSERVWFSQEHFLGAAAIAMGHLLIDLARARNARKRR